MKISKVLVVYYTRTGNTGKMAKAIAEGAESAGAEVVVKTVNGVGKEDVSSSDAIIIGSPTHNKRIPYKVTSFLSSLKDLGLQGKLGVSFGSYGWSGEGVSILNKELEKLGIKLVSKGIRVRREPGEADLKDLRELGRKVAEAAG
ncbi:MAG: FprA family A-type flavoprotein [Candidatus Syntrophoarchaeum sp. WYZ-LMO15]|nr:MAG: FprA family A-type flavoprotein [Candidatus Syntrophoarchaeum sp. WYZ-LMO15]